MIINSIYAVIATLCFCVLFNIKGKNMIVSSLGGGIGWFIYLLFQSFHITDVSSLFFASLALSIFSEIMARVLKAPVTTFIVPALIPLVPGGGMYYTMLESVQGNIIASLETGLNTLLSAGSLAVGVVLVSSVSRAMNILKISKESKDTP